MSTGWWWAIGLAAYAVIAVGVIRIVWAKDYVLSIDDAKKKHSSSPNFKPTREQVLREMPPVPMYLFGGTIWGVWVPIWILNRIVRPIGPVIHRWWYRAVDREVRKAGLE